MFEAIIMVIRYAVYWVTMIPVGIFDVINGLMIYVFSWLRIGVMRIIKLAGLFILKVDRSEINAIYQELRAEYVQWLTDVGTMTYL